MKKSLISLLATLILLTFVSFASGITVRVNGNSIDLKGAEAYVDNANRTLVPIRFIADNLQAETSWDNASQTATVKKEGKTIEICIPCKKVKVDGQEVGTDSYGSLRNQRTYVPLRLIAEAFGANVGYANQIVTINTTGTAESSGDIDYTGQDQKETKKPEKPAISESGTYSSKSDVALYIHTYGKLPSNYITKKEAQALGWNNKDGNLWKVAEGKSIGGDRFGNREKLLPSTNGRTWTECDIDYKGGYRNEKRIVFSNDGLIYYTGDHYKSFEKLYG